MYGKINNIVYKTALIIKNYAVFSSYFFVHLPNCLQRGQGSSEVK